jgi:hypothetical protein
MKIFLIDYSLNVLIALIILSVFGTLYEQSKVAYYTFSPIETFYEAGELTASDVCLGDTKQLLTSTRTVKNTSVGYPATVVRELSVLKDGTSIEIYKESVDVFIQAKDNGLVSRHQLLIPLEVGEYRWAIYPVIKTGTVVRNDVPPIISNVFKVYDCSQNNND